LPQAVHSPDESWVAALSLMARQLIPAMAMLLILVIGATLFLNSATRGGSNIALGPSERVLFNDIYDYPEPTPDDVLETLVAVEEREDGK
jgi:hypothetical protein